MLPGAVLRLLWSCRRAWSSSSWIQQVLPISGCSDTAISLSETWCCVMLAKAKAWAALAPWNCVPPPTEELFPSSQQLSLGWEGNTRTNRHRAWVQESPLWVQSRRQFPDRDVAFMLKLGQNRYKSLYCSASVCEHGRRREGGNLGRELGRDVQHEGNILCLLQISEENSCGKGFKKRHWDLYLVLPWSSVQLRSCHIFQKYLRHCCCWQEEPGLMAWNTREKQKCLWQCGGEFKVPISVCSWPDSKGQI